MEFIGDETIYYMPIRFWEETEPIRGVVQASKQTGEVNLNINSKDSICVYSQEYEHNVYIDRKNCFFSKEKCTKAIELYTALHNLYFEDETDKNYERLVMNHNES